MREFQRMEEPSSELYQAPSVKLTGSTWLQWRPGYASHLLLVLEEWQWLGRLTAHDLTRLSTLHSPSAALPVKVGHVCILHGATVRGHL